MNKILIALTFIIITTQAQADEIKHIFCPHCLEPTIMSIEQAKTSRCDVCYAPLNAHGYYIWRWRNFNPAGLKNVAVLINIKSDYIWYPDNIPYAGIAANDFYLKIFYTQEQKLLQEEQEKKKLKKEQIELRKEEIILWRENKTFREEKKQEDREEEALIRKVKKAERAKEKKELQKDVWQPETITYIKNGVKYELKKK